MKINVCFLILVLSILSLTSQNIEVKGTVVDSTSKEPLVYVNIYLAEANRGTTSDENGLFQFKNLDSLRVLRFGYVGYSSKDIDYSEQQPDTIMLVRNSEQLSEVFIQFPKFKKSVKIKGGKGRNNIGISNTNNGESPGALLRFFEKPSKFDKEPAFLSSAEFYLYKGMDDDNREYIFRIRVMSVTDDGNPGSDLITNKTLQAKPGSKISIDLKEENILIPDNGFFIGVEGLQISQNYIRSREIVLENGTTKMLKMYGPTFKGIVANGPVYYYARGDWRKLNMPAPAVNLIITN